MKVSVRLHSNLRRSFSPRHMSALGWARRNTPSECSREETSEFPLPPSTRSPVAEIDSTHMRVTLIGSGYLSPADRVAKIVLQHVRGIACRDTLNGQSLPITEGSVSLTVPAGILRIVDITVG